MSKLRLFTKIGVVVTLVATQAPPAGARAGAVGSSRSDSFERISVASDGSQAEGPSGLSGRTAITSDGDRIIFTSAAPNLGGVSPGIYVRDRSEGLTHFLAISGGGGLGADAAISANGETAVFNSDTCGGLCYVTLGSDGAPLSPPQAFRDAEDQTFYAAEPGISGDGDLVVFHAPREHSFVPLEDGRTFDDVGNIVSTHPGSNTYQYVHAFADPDGGSGRDCNVTEAPAVSFDGRYVAFRGPREIESFVLCGDEGVWVKDAQAGEPVEGSVITGSEGSLVLLGFDLSSDGRKLAFAAAAGLDAQVYLRDLDSLTTTQASVRSNGEPLPGDNHSVSLNHDGNLITFTNVGPDGAGEIFFRDIAQGRTTRLTRSDESSGGSKINAEGTVVTFSSLAGDLIDDDTNESTDVFLIELSTSDIEVNSKRDGEDEDSTDGICDTGGVVDGETECTLRAAIQEANEQPAANTISFHIGRRGPQTISPKQVLPTITDQVTIDGTAQPGFKEKPLIRLDGSRTGQGGGLRVEMESNFMDPSRIESLWIYDFPGNGISAVFPTLDLQIEDNWIGRNGANGVLLAGRVFGARIEGNRIGTDAPGSPDAGNGQSGIAIEGSRQNIVGGIDEAARNVIAGNHQDGIRIGPDADGNESRENEVRGNLIGLTAKQDPRPNLRHGILLTSQIPGGPANAVVSDNVIADNVVAGNRKDGVHLLGVSLNHVENNLIGTDSTGAVALGNGGDGIELHDANFNVIGGDGLDDGNVISGNGGRGVLIAGPHAQENLVEGNAIGTSADGETDLGNAEDGIEIRAPAGTVAQGGLGPIRTEIRRNLISGNEDDGIFIRGPETHDNVVVGNSIGTNFFGTRTIPNLGVGVDVLSSDDNLIGGSTSDDRNVVSGNGLHGIDINSSDGNTVQGNYVGTDALGDQALGNEGDGVHVVHGSSENVIGGVEPGSGNVISGNGGRGELGAGISLASGIGNVIHGNFIGTDATGTAELGNLRSGILVGGAEGSAIGGAAPQAGNVVSGNREHGIHVSGSTDLAIHSNRIGTDLTGTQALGNRFDGVHIEFNASGIAIGGPSGENVISGNDGSGIAIEGEDPTGITIEGNMIGTGVDEISDLGNGESGIGIQDASGVVIGGTDAGTANVIARNSVGVSVAFGAGNSILGNRIFLNDVMGIDLRPRRNQVDVNDPLDADTKSGNFGQNFPGLESAVLEDGSLSVTGELQSAPSQIFTVELFVNSGCSPKGFGEGETLLHSFMLVTGPTGMVTFDTEAPPSFLTGQFITSTATDAAGNTSEFSECVPVEGA